MKRKREKKLYPWCCARDIGSFASHAGQVRLVQELRKGRLPIDGLGVGKDVDTLAAGLPVHGGVLGLEVPARRLHGADGGEAGARDLAVAGHDGVPGGGGGAARGRHGRVGRVEGVGDGDAGDLAAGDDLGGAGRYGGPLRGLVVVGGGGWLATDEVGAVLVGLDNGVGDDVGVARVGCSSAEGVGLFLVLCLLARPSANADEDDDGGDDEDDAATDDTTDDGPNIRSISALHVALAGPVMGRGARGRAGPAARGRGGLGGRRRACARLVALGRLGLVGAPLALLLVGAGVSERAAAVSAARKLDVKDVGLNGSFRVLLGIQVVQVAGDGLDLVAAGAIWTTQDGRVAGQWHALVPA